MHHATVLIIDDSRLVRKMYQHQLLVNSYHVLTADSGETGLDVLRQNKVDLVMLDLGLPGIGGIEVLETIMGDESLRAIPVVVFSAKEQETLMEKALELGAKEFIAKATTPVEKVIEKIRTVLEHSRTEHEARHYRIALDPVSLDAHDLATALGLDCLACGKCDSGLIVELTPEAVSDLRSTQHLDARIICPVCEAR
ncbi:MAG: response regulator [bacterium]|nr:response regulator [bacterium]